MKESIGNQLRAARLSRQLSLEEVSKETHIKLHYLEALEADAFERLPSLFQTRGFLRVYGSFLGLDSEALVNQLNSQRITEDKPTLSFPISKRSLPSATTAKEIPSQPSALAREEALRPASASREHLALNDDSLPFSSQVSADTQAIFSQIGAELRRTRTQLGLSIEEVERQTHLRAHHIQIMEEGKFERLASPVQGKGLLQIYSSFLGLNPDTILLRYAEALQAQLAARQAKHPRLRAKELRSTNGKSYSWLWSAEFLVMVLLSLATLAFVAWGLPGIIRTGASLPPTPTLLSVAEALLAIDEEVLGTATAPPPTHTATPALEAINPTPVQENEQALTQIPLPATPGKVQVLLAVQQRAWLRVIVDEQELYNGRIAPGGLLEFNGEQKIEIQTGNAAALKVIYNQQDLGILGGVGEVVTRVFTPQGVLQPTATVTPTATRTPRPSPTPRPTLTPRPTRTFTPVATSSPTPLP